MTMPAPFPGILSGQNTASQRAAHSQRAPLSSLAVQKPYAVYVVIPQPSLPQCAILRSPVRSTLDQSRLSGIHSVTAPITLGTEVTGTLLPQQSCFAHLQLDRGLFALSLLLSLSPATVFLSCQPQTIVISTAWVHFMLRAPDLGPGDRSSPTH